ncbi:MAG: YdcF family protein [Cyclobacteriaceae bacterium]|nr:YdcF family protein [Cyclobacteriaceae bacterium]
MFFFFSKALAFMLNPMFWITGLLVAAIFSDKKRKTLLLYTLVGVFCFSNPFLANLALRALEEPPAPLDKPADIAVVLTGMINPYARIDDQLSFDEGADRITEAIRLYKQEKVKKLLISGGFALWSDASFTENTSLVRIAIEFGVNPADILIEDKSRNTHENALFTAQILQTQPQSRLVLITSAFHMKRASGCFRHEGLSTINYPVDFRSAHWLDAGLIPDATALSTWSLIAKEVTGLIVYRIAGYL